MKLGRVSTLFVATASILASFRFTEIVHAQAIIQNEPPATKQRLIRLKNVAPDVMAYWLDPTHNEMPAQLRSSNTVSKVKPAGLLSAGIFQLPEGVESISPVAPQNALLVLGASRGIDQLQDTINLLDRPLRQIEIETLFIQIAPEDMKAFGLDLNHVDFDDQPKSNFQVGFVRGNFQMTLNGLLAKKKAKLLASPRITAVNNQSARIVTSQLRSATVGYKDQEGKFHEVVPPTSATAKPGLKIGASFELTVVPTINNDNTITLLLEPKRILQLVGEGEKQTITLDNSEGFEMIANTRGGDTVALTGLDSGIFRGVETEKEKISSNVLTFITARIIRRVADLPTTP
jgi:type II secretory pathway component GspD/PulD (secretin)